MAEQGFRRFQIMMTALVPQATPGISSAHAAGSIFGHISFTARAREQTVCRSSRRLGHANLGDGFDDCKS